MKNWENNGTEEIGLVTPIPGQPGRVIPNHKGRPASTKWSWKGLPWISDYQNSRFTCKIYVLEETTHISHVDR